MEYVIEVFCITFIFGYLFYKWANKNYDCFSKRNVAHEKPVFLIGNNLTVLEGKESSPDFLIRIHRQFKDQKIYGHYEFRSPLFFIRDPELIYRIAIKDFDSFTNRPENNALLSNETIGSMLSELKDEKWTEMRAILTRAFQENKINQVYQTISECQREAIKHLKRTIKLDGKEINFAGYFQRYSNDVIASAAFGLEINSYKDEKNDFSDMTSTLLRTRSLCVAIKSFYLTIFPQVLRIYRLNRIYIKIMAFIRNLIGRKVVSPYKEKSDTENAIDHKKDIEFVQLIKGLIRKSSSAIISLVLTIFPQISFIFYIYGFVQSIRNYVRSIFSPKVRQPQEMPVTPYQDIEVTPVKKRNQFLTFGTRVLRNISTSIKLLVFTLFPQVLWISRVYFLTKAALKYLKGKPNQEAEPKNKKKKLSKMEAALVKFERFVIVMKIIVLTYFPKTARVIKLSAFNARALKYLKNLAQQTIENRQDCKIIRNDIIQLMFESQKCEQKNVDDDDEHCFTKETTNRLTQDEMVAQCILFLFSGLEPITKTLCSTVYELMQNPEIQEKLFEEISTVNNELNGSEITYEIVENMMYLDMVISETLRKWPIQPLLTRVCSKPYSLNNEDGELIAELKPGDNVCFSVYGSHFDEEYFENPFVFDPERFNDKNKPTIRPLTYFPFGVGARSCIGYKFGLMAAKIMLYHLVLQFKFTSGSKTIPDLFAVHRKIQLKQSDFFWMTIVPRIKQEISPYVEM